MRKWYPILPIAIAMAASIYVYPRLPDSVPTHYDIRGVPNDYGPKWIATALFPAMLVVLWAVMRGLPKIDPRQANYARMQSTYDLVVNLVLTMVGFGKTGGRAVEVFVPLLGCMLVYVVVTRILRMEELRWVLGRHH